MAVIFTIAGGIAGFASALASLVLMDATLLTALAIWSGTGFLVLIAGMVFVLLPQRGARQPAQSRHSA
jgi:uncharacterized membrane protein YjfL (UPF0719 family)